jgi:hypothetical protein
LILTAWGCRCSTFGVLIEIYTDASPAQGGFFGLLVLIPETNNWAYSVYDIPPQPLGGGIPCSTKAELYAMLWATAWAQETWPMAIVRAHTDNQIAAHAYGVLIGNFGKSPGWAASLQALAQRCDFRRCLLPVWLPRSHEAISICDKLVRRHLAEDLAVLQDRSRSILRALERFFNSRLGLRSEASRHVRRQLWRREALGKAPSLAGGR